METKLTAKTAKVLQFPWQSVRAAASEARLLSAIRPVLMPRIAPANCWYHDTAIAEDQGQRRH
jgi:hypothetical protein